MGSRSACLAQSRQPSAGTAVGCSFATTPPSSRTRATRHVIAYVLGNWRRHNAHIENGRFSTAMLDRFSSAISFTGCFAIPRGYKPLPLSSPTTALLVRGWAFNGPLDPEHVPGPPRW